MFQSLLLLAQTVSSRQFERPIVLNGDLIKLGEFRDVHTFDTKSPNVSVKLDFEPREDNKYFNMIQSISCQIEFSVEGPSLTSEPVQLQPNLKSSYISCTERNGDRAYLKAVSREDINKKENTSFPKNHYPYTLLSDAKSRKRTFSRFGGIDLFGCSMHFFFPSEIALEYDPILYIASQIILSIKEGSHEFFDIPSPLDDDQLPPEITELIFSKVKDSQLRSFLREQVLGEKTEMTISELLSSTPVLGIFLRDNYPKDWKRLTSRHLYDQLVSVLRSQKIAKLKSRIIPVPVREYNESISRAEQYLDQYFTSRIQYLGPLREEPRPTYPFVSHRRPSDIGLRGEYTAAVLHRFEDYPISYIPPTRLDGLFSSASGDVSEYVKQSTLKEAVVDWLKHMKIANSVVTRDLGKYGFEMQVTTPGTSEPQDLTYVGVGVSQVLPILVICILADPASTLVIEQPELHLHPKVQTLLADFFLAKTLLNTQLLIETHSEYLINRLRFRIASTKQSSMDLNSLISIYFSRKERGRTRFENLIINEFGAIQNWPRGFFDESQIQSGEILRAASIKREELLDDRNNP